mgnify:CR=1 FL=1
MPELPEVQTTVNGLQKIINKHIVGILINTRKLRYIVPRNLKKIAENSRIKKIYRIAKYIVIDVSGSKTLIFHLGMSGRIKIIKTIKYKTSKHDHILLKLENKSFFVFNDMRKFGFVDIANTKDLLNKKYFIKLGLDPFDLKLNKNYLLDKFKNSKVSLKQMLLNQQVISGIGNIYACEILFDAKLSPFIEVKKLKSIKIDKLIISIRKILSKAIVYGGTTIKDYESTDGTLGNFQNNFKVYNKNNQKILNFTIKRIKQSGRSTYYCPELQKG